MTLKDYIAANEHGSVTRLSKDAGVTRAMIYNYLEGATPSLKVAYKIEVSTNKAVTLYDWIEDKQKEVKPEVSLESL